MSKSDQIKKALNENSYNWEYLAYDGGHIRVHGFGDIWLSTATYKLEDSNHHHRKDLKGLLKLLGKGLNGDEKHTGADRITMLEERLAHLEHELEQLKADMGVI